MHIGLVGGIGPAATDYYYRWIIDVATRRDFGFDLTIVHADTPTLLRNLLGGDKTTQVTIFSRLTECLKAAGVLRLFFMGPNAMGPVIRSSLKASE